MAAFSHTLPVRNSNKREGGKYYVHDIYSTPFKLQFLLETGLKYNGSDNYIEH